MTNLIQGTRETYDRDGNIIKTETIMVRDPRPEIRKSALAEKWPDPFDLLDDILNRGAEVVKAERDAIKAENPKGE